MTRLLTGSLFYRGDFPMFLNRETEAFDTPPHRHDFIELCLVAEGRGYHYIEEQTLAVQKGDLFLIPIGTSHVFRPATSDPGNPLVVCNFIFDLAALKSMTDWIPRESELQRLLYSPERLTLAWFRTQDKQDRFQSLFNQAYRENIERPVGYQAMVSAILIQILQLVHREQSRPIQPLAASEPPLEKMDDAIRFIELHYSDKLTLKSVAERSYMSVNHFQNQFKKVTGLTFNHYLQNVRIRKCCQLLRTTEISVQQSAHEVGYSDMKFFHSLFRKITGHSPQQYRHA
jgi:AraC-like DNA-binding protein